MRKYHDRSILVSDLKNTFGGVKDYISTLSEEPKPGFAGTFSSDDILHVINFRDFRFCRKLREDCSKIILNIYF
jgi:hypothetical protein